MMAGFFYQAGRLHHSGNKHQIYMDPELEVSKYVLADSLKYFCSSVK
jgi:hypothetical protein